MTKYGPWLIWPYGERRLRKIIGSWTGVATINVIAARDAFSGSSTYYTLAANVSQSNGEMNIVNVEATKRFKRCRLEFVGTDPKIYECFIDTEVVSEV